MGESDSFSRYWPKYEKINKKNKKYGPDFAGKFQRRIYFRHCQQMPCDRKLVKCASFESVITWHLIKV